MDRRQQETLEQEHYMSIVCCFGCGCWIDSDKNPECFDDQDKPYCKECAPEDGGGKDYTKQVEQAMRGDFDAE